MIDRPRGAAPVAHLSTMSPPRPPPSELVAGRFPSRGRAGPQRRSNAASRWLVIASLVSLGPRAGEDYLVPGGPVAACDALGRPFRTPPPPSRRTGARYAAPTAPPPATSTPWSFGSDRRWQPRASGRSGQCSGNGAPAPGGASPTAARCRMRPPCDPRQSSAPRMNPRSLAGDRHCDLGY